MSRIALTILATIALILTACGGPRTERSFPVDQAMTASNPEGVTAKLIYFKQSKRYLIVSVQFSNDTKEKVTLKNEGSSQLPGFTATCEGRQLNADRRGSTGWNPWTGVTRRDDNAGGNLEIAPGQKTELQIRFNYSPDLSRKDFNWTVLITNIFVGDKKAGDLTFSYDPKTAEK